MPPYQKKKSQQIKKSVVRSKEKVSTKLKKALSDRKKVSNNWKICANEHKIRISRLKNCFSKSNLCVSTEQNKILNKSTCQPIEKVNYIMDGNFVWLLVPTRLISDFQLVATYVRLEESRWDICSMMNRPIAIQPFSEKAICGFKMLITSKPFIRWVWNSVFHM